MSSHYRPLFIVFKCSAKFIYTLYTSFKINITVAIVRSHNDCKMLEVNLIHLVSSL